VLGWSVDKFNDNDNGKTKSQIQRLRNTMMFTVALVQSLAKSASSFFLQEAS